MALLAITPSALKRTFTALVCEAIAHVGDGSRPAVQSEDSFDVDVLRVLERQECWRALEISVRHGCMTCGVEAAGADQLLAAMRGIVVRRMRDDQSVPDRHTGTAKEDCPAPTHASLKGSPDEGRSLVAAAGIKKEYPRGMDCGPPGGFHGQVEAIRLPTAPKAAADLQKHDTHPRRRLNEPKLRARSSTKA